jgi:hypothetical protein
MTTQDGESFMVKQILVLMLMGLLLLTGVALGGFGLSENASSESQSISGTDAFMGGDSVGSSHAIAPNVAATGSVDNQAVYSSQAPSQGSLGMLQPVSATTGSTGQIYYNGDYLAWQSFTSTFPANLPGLWIAGYNGWSWYVTMPLGTWAQELLYVPEVSAISMYEFYPNGYITEFSLGYFQPGYYTIWYYADTIGEHVTQFVLDGSFSNAVVIRVDNSIPQPQPVSPTEKELCEENPTCDWVNGQCLCKGYNPQPDPATECEKNPTCDWVNGQCLCKGFNPQPDPAAECEKNPTCDWVNGQCLCKGYNPNIGMGQDAAGSQSLTGSMNSVSTQVSTS